MITVFHVITTINRGGAENQLLVLVKEQIKLGLNVHVIYLKGEPELEPNFTEIGASIHHEVAIKTPFLQPFILRQIIGRRRCIVHAHLPRAELVALFTPKIFYFVSSRHNAEPFFPGKPRLLSNLLSWLVEIRSSKIIAISEAVRAYLIARGEIRNSGKIEVVLYGYEPRFTRGAVEYKTGHDLRQLGTISRLVDQKDIPTMLGALKELQMTVPNASLSILGAGPMENQLTQLVSSMKLDSFVTFHGKRSDVYVFLSTLDAFILTSKYEGFGLVLLEAMDAGVPIIAARNSAIPEVLGADFLGLCETGNPSDFANKILMLADPKFRISILQMQEARLKLFDAKAMANKVTQLYPHDY